MAAARHPPEQAPLARMAQVAQAAQTPRVRSPRSRLALRVRTAAARSRSGSGSADTRASGKQGTSHARGAARPDSNVDVAVVLDEVNDFEERG